MLDTLNHWLERRSVRWMLLAMIAAIYAASYRSHPLFPGFGDAAFKRGWWTWTDQQRYLDEANAIAAGQLSRTTFHYPVGYPALGAVFVRWMPVHPFFIPNLLLVLVAAGVWWQLARRWLSAIEALIAGSVFLIFHRLLLGVTLVVPWNTIATQATALTGIWVLLAMNGRRAVFGLGALTALTVFFRPIDAVAYLPLLAWAIFRLDGWPQRVRVGLVAAAVVGVAIATTIAVNLAVFGQTRTPYDDVSLRSIGFFGYPISLKLYWLLLDGQPLFGETEPGLLFRYPWMFLGAPAIVFLVRKERMAGVAVALTVFISAGLYLNYNDLLPSDIYRFTLIHYLVWWFPLLFVLIAAAARYFRQDRVVRAGFGVAAFCVIVGLGLRLESRRLPQVVHTGDVVALPPHRPLLLEFESVSMDAVSSLRIEGRPLVEYSEYLVPYVPSDLRLLLSRNVRGSSLSGPAVSAVQMSEYTWRWRLQPLRLRDFGR
ncbi:MAG: hypothetical protein ABIZ04_24745 [Opitutus sp.]